MNKVQPLLRGLVAPTLLFVAACSTAPVETPPPAVDDPAAPEAVEPATPQDPPPQQVQGVGQQRQDVLVQQALSNARRSMELRLFVDAAREAAFALELDPDNAEARDILLRASDLMGVGTLQTRIQDQILRDRIAQERDRFRIGHEMELGEAEVGLGRYGEAIDRYQRALVILRSSVHFQANSTLEQQIDARLAAAREDQQQAAQQEQAARLAASQAELDDLARRDRIAQDARVQRLLEGANSAFQLGRFETAVGYLDQALQTQPSNENAQALRDLAGRARHENRMDVLRQRWREEWSTTFDDLRTMDVPQSRQIVFDIDRWAEISQRQPASFIDRSELESPEERAILRRLQDARLPIRFSSATVDDWANYFASVTEVNFYVTDGVRDLDLEETTLTDFTLPTMSVFRALNIIREQTGVAWQVNRRTSMVDLLLPEDAGGIAYSMPYDVRDLVTGAVSSPGVDLKLSVPGEEDIFGGFDDFGDEPTPTVVDEGTLQDLIMVHIAPDAWGDTASVNYQNGILLVRANQQIQEAVSGLLSDLRRHVGIQIDVEARFLKVDDNFLEDIGVDFRGLGDNAAEGASGRGLENRPNTRFDDFGPPQLINPASPGPTGTGTEPGFFYDDGQDGDILARTEHLFDQILRVDQRIDNAGGLAFQWAYLDDAEVEVILRAVEKRERSEEIQAPRLLIYNNTRASMSFLRQVSYIKDFDVEIAQASTAANPVVDVVNDGVSLDVRPVVDADLKFITMELRPTVMQLQLPLPTFTTTLGVGQPISIQLPNVILQRVRTTVTMPDGGSMMLGGMRLLERIDRQSGVPILSSIPILSFFFSRQEHVIQHRKILIMIRAKIILSEEYEPLLAPARPNAGPLAGR